MAYNNFINSLGIPLTEKSLETGMFDSTRKVFINHKTSQLYYSSSVFFETMFI